MSSQPDGMALCTFTLKTLNRIVNSEISGVQINRYIVNGYGLSFKVFSISALA